MGDVSIWAKAKGKPPEKVDSASPKEAAYLAREYQMAFGPAFVVWAGRKDQNPQEEKP